MSSYPGTPRWETRRAQRGNTPANTTTASSPCIYIDSRTSLTARRGEIDLMIVEEDLRNKATTTNDDEARAGSTTHLTDMQDIMGPRLSTSGPQLEHVRGQRVCHNSLDTHKCGLRKFWECYGARRGFVRFHRQCCVLRTFHVNVNV